MSPHRAARTTSYRRRALGVVALAATALLLALALAPAPAQAAVPTADDFSETVSEGKSIDIFLFVHALDDDGDSLTFAVVSPPAHGSLDDCSTGLCTYTATAGYTGPDSFTWKVNDGTDDSNVATASITIVANQAPVAEDGSFSADKDATTPIFLTANDPDGDSLTYSIVTPPTHGDLTPPSGDSVDYTPDAGYEGPDSFTWKANDGTADSNVATTTLDVIPAPTCDTITNGTVQLGVNATGELNLASSLCPESSGGTSTVGLRYVPTNAEATAPGCLCEGWGVADATASVTGSANRNDGNTNVEVESFVRTATTAVSKTLIKDDGSANVFRVTQDYHPSLATSNLYEVTVTIENLSDHTVAPRYRRVMDWDVEPTAFTEYSTIQGTAAAANVLFASDDGFASANPLAGPSSIDFTGDAVDNGPDDHGALFDFGFPDLTAGQSTQFTIFYGAAPTEAAADAALGAAQAEVYSYGQPSTPDGPTLGTPNTFIFAFRGVGGEVQIPAVQLSSPTYTAAENGGSATITATLTAPSDEPVTVAYATSPGTATAGSDYTSASGTLTFPPGSTTATFPVPVLPDGETDPGETVNLTLSAPTGAVLGSPATGVLTITEAVAVTPTVTETVTQTVTGAPTTATATVTGAPATVTQTVTVPGSTATVTVPVLTATATVTGPPATVTQTVPGPTATVTATEAGPATTVTSTVTGPPTTATSTVTGPPTTVTATVTGAGATSTVTGPPTTVTATVTGPGSTVTITGPTTTVTATGGHHPPKDHCKPHKGMSGAHSMSKSTDRHCDEHGPGKGGPGKHGPGRCDDGHAYGVAGPGGPHGTRPVADSAGGTAALVVLTAVAAAATLGSAYGVRLPSPRRRH